MRQRDERVNLNAVQNKKQWLDRVSIFAAMVVVLIWLFASWSAPAAQLVSNAWVDALTSHHDVSDDDRGSQKLLLVAAQN